MTKKNATKTAARSRQRDLGGKYESHMRHVAPAPSKQTCPAAPRRLGTLLDDLGISDARLAHILSRDRTYAIERPSPLVAESPFASILVSAEEGELLLGAQAIDERKTHIVCSFQPDLACYCGSRFWCGGPEREVPCHCARRFRIAPAVADAIARASTADPRWFCRATGDIHFEAIWRLRAATDALRAALANHEDTEDAAYDVHDLASHVRAMSRDEAWKAPCNRVREGLLRVRADEVSIAGFLDLADGLLATLPEAELEPFDYWPSSRTLFSARASIH